MTGRVSDLSRSARLAGRYPAAGRTMRGLDALMAAASLLVAVGRLVRALRRLVAL